MLRRSSRKRRRVKGSSPSPSPDGLSSPSASAIDTASMDAGKVVKTEIDDHPIPKGSGRKRKSDGKQKASPPEKRAARFRGSCPIAILDRMERVMSQRMFMVHRTELEPAEDGLSSTFSILGSTGNLYTVRISTTPTCDCPDFLKGNSPCKHILFIFLKVLKVPLISTFWYQKALLPDELASIFASAPASTEALASEAVQKAFRTATSGDTDATEDVVKQELVGQELLDETGPGGRRLTAIGDDCPICFEEMTRADFESGKLVFDVSVGGCGKPLHNECFGMWRASAKDRSSAAVCVWCRATWAAPTPHTKDGIAYTKSGYMNMASIAGMSGVRDTSTYHHHFVKGGKGKTWADVYAEGDELI